MTTLDMLRPLSEGMESDSRPRRPSRFPLIHEELEARELLSVGPAMQALPVSEPIALGVTAQPGNPLTSFGGLQSGISVQTTGAGGVQFLQSSLPVTDLLDNLSLASDSVYATPGPFTVSSGLLSLPITPLIPPLLTTTETPLHNGTILTGTVWITVPPLTIQHFQRTTLISPPVSNSMLQVPSQESIPRLVNRFGQSGTTPSAGALDAPTSQVGPEPPMTVDQVEPSQPGVNAPQPSVSQPSEELTPPSRNQPSPAPAQPGDQSSQQRGAAGTRGAPVGEPGGTTAQPGTAAGQQRGAAGTSGAPAGQTSTTGGQQGSTSGQQAAGGQPSGAGGQRQGGQPMPQNPGARQQGQGAKAKPNDGSRDDPSAHLSHPTPGLGTLPIAADFGLIDVALDDLDTSSLNRPPDDPEPDTAVPTLLGAALVATGGYHIALRRLDHPKRPWVAGPAESDGLSGRRFAAPSRN